jgi:hypothetical protein
MSAFGIVPAAGVSVPREHQRIRRGATVREAGILDAGAGASAQLTVGLLDGFRLEKDGGVLPLSLAEQRLVAFLAVHNRPLQRLFWPGICGSTATNSTPAATCGRRSGGCVISTPG